MQKLWHKFENEMRMMARCKFEVKDKYLRGLIAHK